MKVTTSGLENGGPTFLRSFKSKCNGNVLQYITTNKVSNAELIGCSTINYGKYRKTSLEKLSEDKRRHCTPSPPTGNTEFYETGM